MYESAMEDHAGDAGGTFYDIRNAGSADRRNEKMASAAELVPTADRIVQNPR